MERKSHYSESCKRKVVAKAEASGSVSQTARELGISSKTLHASAPVRSAALPEQLLLRKTEGGPQSHQRQSLDKRRIRNLLDSGATQLEISAMLPIKSWQAIRRKIVQLRRVGVEVPDAGHLEDADTIHAHLERNPSAAGTMPFLILTNSSPRLPQNKNHHCSGSLKPLNLAKVDYLDRVIFGSNPSPTFRIFPYEESRIQNGSHAVNILTAQ
jgi:transposase-like protein